MRDGAEGARAHPCSQPRESRSVSERLSEMAAVIFPITHRSGLPAAHGCRRSPGRVAAI